MDDESSDRRIAATPESSKSEYSEKLREGVCVVMCGGGGVEELFTVVQTKKKNFPATIARAVQLGFVSGAVRKGARGN